MDQKNLSKKLHIEQLVAQAQQGQSNAFAQLYDIFIDPIYRYIYFRTGPKEAEDLTEIVFLKTWEHIHQYRFAKHSFSAWIFRIAHNVVVDYYRSNHTVDELSESLEDESKESNSLHQVKRWLDQKVLSEALSQLKENHRQFIILKYINDFPNEEIEHIIGKSQPALRILQFRALKNLRHILEKMGFTESDL